MGDRSGRAHIVRLRGVDVEITMACAKGNEKGVGGRPPHEQLLEYAERKPVKTLPEERTKEYIGGSVDWSDQSLPPVVSWRSGQVNLGFIRKEGVGTGNWSVHETLRDLKSTAFCDNMDMRGALWSLDKAVARFVQDHWHETELESSNTTSMGKVVQGFLPGVCQEMRMILKKREEVLFADGHAKSDEDLLALGKDDVAVYQRRIEQKENDAQAWFELGLCYGGRVHGEKYGTKACYEQALHHKPDHADAWYQLGLQGGGKVSGTAYNKKACYEQALHHIPDYADAWYNLGVQGGGKVSGTAYDEKACYEQALHHIPDYADAWYNLGVRGGGKVSGTAYNKKACYEQALHHKPGDGHASAWLSLGFEGGGKVSGTAYNEKACYEQALHYKPDYADAWYNLGVRGGGKVSGTAYNEKACYEQALHYKPDHADAWYNLGVRGGGKVSGTAYNKKACYEQALHHKPDDALAYKALNGGCIIC